MSSRVVRPHIPALDGIRGIAILLVLLNHSAGFSLVPFEGWESLFTNVVSSTGLGVQLFFVLSGFLITGLLLDAKGSPRYFSSFYGRRALRILPLYYGTIILFALYLHFRGSGYEVIFHERLPWLLTFTQNVLITVRQEWSFVFGRYSLGHFWSLAVEEQFYLIWPVVVLWCSARTLERICFFLIPVALVMRIGFVWGEDNILGAFVFLPCAMDSLAMGAVVAVLVREKRRQPQVWPCS